MPVLRERLHSAPACNKGVIRHAHCASTTPLRKLGASLHLIAPAQTLTLPSLEGVRTNFEINRGFQAALAPARTLVEKGLLIQKHLSGATSVVEALSNALTDLVEKASGSSKDEFGIEIYLTDRIDDRQPSADCLFFAWTKASDVEYIPLRPVFDQLEGNKQRERLMATLYYWIYQTASTVFMPFGFEEATSTYEYRKAVYQEGRDSGEDVDLEGEVEFANLSSVVDYIRLSDELKLKEREVELVVSSIKNPCLREAFRKAHSMWVLSRQIKLPDMTSDCEQILKDATFYMWDSAPGIGVSHWRDDAVVSWLDDVCQDIFNSGVECCPSIVRCFRAADTLRFSQILTALPKMVQVSVALSEWVRIARELEHEGHYSDR
jgi:hypothetical protein